MIEFIAPPESGSLRPFSRAVRAGGMVYVSGHSAPYDPARGILRGDSATEQVRNALLTMRAILADAGSSLDRVVQVTMLLTDRSDYAECNAEYVKHFQNSLPARNTVLFGVPTDAKVAFSCIALAGD